MRPVFFESPDGSDVRDLFRPQETEALIRTMVQDIESERDNSIATARAPAL